MKRKNRGRKRISLAILLSLCLAVTALSGGVTVRAQEEQPTAAPKAGSPASDEAEKIDEGLSEEGEGEEKEQQAAPEEERKDTDTQEGQEENSRTDGEDNVLHDIDNPDGDPDADLEEELSEEGADVSGNDISNMTADEYGIMPIREGIQGTVGLQITKKVDGDTSTEESFPFHVDVKVDRKFFYYYIGTSWSGWEDTRWSFSPGSGGVFSQDFELKNGETIYVAITGEQSIDARDFSIGGTFTVTETDSKGYDVSYQIGSGDSKEGKVTEEITLSATGYDNLETVTFTNSKPSVPKGNLTVTKEIEGTAASEADVFPFTVTLGDSNINGTYGGMDFTDGVADFRLKGGESVTASGLPAGITYTVTEDDSKGYTSTSTGEQGTIPENDTAAAVFVNRKDKTGSLTVTKKIEGTAASAADAFPFTVTLGDSDISGTYGGMDFTDGVAGFRLKGGESVTASGLPAGITYTVTEDDSKGYTSTSTGANGTIPENDTAAAVFVNRKDAPKPEQPGPTDPGDSPTPPEPSNPPAPTTVTPPTPTTVTPPAPETVSAPEQGVLGALREEPAPSQGVLGEIRGPQTGDTSNPALWIMLMAAAVSVMEARVVTARKKE